MRGKIAEKITRFRYLKPLSYALLFIFAFIAFLFGTFPTDILKGRIIKEIVVNTPFEAEIKSIKISPLLSVRLDGIKIYKSKDSFLEINSLRINPSLFEAVSKNPKIPFEVEFLDGQAKGSIRLNKQNGSLQEVGGDIKGVSLDPLPALLFQKAEEALLLRGSLDGQFYVNFDPVPSGDFQFDVNGLELSNVVVKQITLPSFGGLSSSLEGSIEGQTTKIKEFSIRGNGLDLQVTGSTPLVWEFSKGGIVDLAYRVKITGGEFAQYKTLLSAYLPKQGDGGLGGKIQGTVNSPRFEAGL